MTNTEKKNNLIILTGPTAVGKTALSLKLANDVGGEIVSADSIQVYKHFDIGSAKILPEEMQGIPHILWDQKPSVFPAALYNFCSAHWSLLSAGKGTPQGIPFPYFCFSIL